jgi:hypothetical protein
MAQTTQLVSCVNRFLVGSIARSKRLVRANAAADISPTATSARELRHKSQHRPCWSTTYASNAHIAILYVRTHLGLLGYRCPLLICRLQIVAQTRKILEVIVLLTGGPHQRWPSHRTLCPQTFSIQQVHLQSLHMYQHLPLYRLPCHPKMLGVWTHAHGATKRQSDDTQPTLKLCGRKRTQIRLLSCRKQLQFRRSFPWNC